MEFIKQKFNIILLVAITVVGGTGVVILYTKSQSASSQGNPLSILADPLLKTAEEDIKSGFQALNTPYKDLAVSVVTNDGSVALVKGVFTARTACELMAPVQYWGMPYGITPAGQASMNVITPGLTKLGYASLSLQNYYQLLAMGVAWRDTNWKRCYTIMEYHKVNDMWSVEKIYDSTRSDLYLLPPQDQEKAGYKLDDEAKKGADDLFMETLAEIARSRYQKTTRSSTTINEFNAVPVSDNKVLSKIMEPRYNDENTESNQRNYNEISQIYALAMTDHYLDELFLTDDPQTICFKPKTTILEKFELGKAQYDKSGKTNSACANGREQDCYLCK